MEDWYHPTTGAVLKDTQRPAIEDKPQARETTVREFVGGAFSANPKDMQRPNAGAPRTQNLPGMGTGPVVATTVGRGDRDDKGKASIQIYSNSRDITSAKVYQGNVASLVKSITAPLMDIVKPNIGSCPHIVYNPREDGNLKGPSRIRVYDPEDVMRVTLKEGLTNDAIGAVNFVGPTRSRVYDPDDVAKTTSRQTLLNESEKINLRGPSRATVYDPHDVTKTTMRQTTLSESEKVNLRGPSRATVYDPHDVTKTTMRQTTLSESEKVNLHGPSRATVHDPDDILRTTMRQTLLSSSENANLRGPSRTRVYDPEDIMKTTLRQTLLQESDNLNFNPANPKNTQVYASDDDPRTTHRETLGSEDIGSLHRMIPNTIVYDPEDIARATMKQTLIDAERPEGGNPDGLEGQRGAYMSTEYEARHTQKEVISDTDYYGQGAYDKGTGYETAPTDLRPAAKAVLSDNDYYGTAGDSIGAQMSHEEYENANMNDTAELLIEGRSPTNSAAKVVAGAEYVGEVAYRKPIIPQEDRRTPTCQVPVGPEREELVTHEPQVYGDLATRLDAEADGNRVQLRENPLNIRVGS